MPLPPSTEYSALHFRISTKMTESLKSSHRSMVVVKALSPKKITTNIPVVSGSVIIDRTSKDFRRSISFVTNDESLIPHNDYDPLNIYGQHIFAYRGVLWDPTRIPQQLWDSEAHIPDWLLRFDNLVDENGKPKENIPQWAIDLAENPPYELIPLGVFRINTVQIDEPNEAQLQINVTGSDISNNIGRNHWTNPVTIWTKKYSVPVSKTDTTPEQTYVVGTASTPGTIQEAIKILIKDRWPLRSPVFGEPIFNFAGSVDAKLTSPVIMGARTVSSSGSNSPWTDITGLATALGAELFVDRDGKFTLKSIDDPNTVQACWSFRDGENGLLTNVSKKLDDSKSVNYVIATGENTATKKPLKAIAFDGDPNSPTYYLGEYGKTIGYEPGRKKLTTQAMVQNAADKYLNAFIGGDETTTLEGICNPAIDAGDVVLVRRKRVGIFDKDTIVGGLTADTGTKTITKISVSGISMFIPKGEKLILYTDAGSETITVADDVSIGAKTISINPITPTLDYRKGTAVLDPSVPSDGSIPYYVEKVTIPLEPQTAMSLTCRARRSGTKQDIIRSAEYSQGY